MRYRASIAFCLCLAALVQGGTARGDERKTPKMTAGGIQVAMINSDEISVPGEFRVALYENLIHQLEERGFKHVYRDGDRNAAGTTNLVVVQCTVRRFKAGNEMAREVTTVAGATSISIQCQFRSAEGELLLEQDVTGRVRFFGGNLRATYDFGKKASRIAYKYFPPAKDNS